MSGSFSHVSELAPRIFASWFPEASWATWRIVIRATAGKQLSPAELVVFREVAGGRDPPVKPVRELHAAVGRRGGKDNMAAAIVSAAALCDYTPSLRRGERAVCLLLAVDRATADICRGYVSAHFASDPTLRAMIVRETREGLELNNRCDIVIGTNSFRLVRGRTLACVVMDEIAFWRDENSANPDREVYRAVRPGLSTLRGLLVTIGSPYRKAGLQWDRFKKYYGKNDDRVLFVKGPTIAFNPTADPEEIAAAYEDDPESARAEWGGEFRDDLASYIDVELIESLVDRGVKVRPPVPDTLYYAFVDAASGTGQDFFTAAIGHREGDVLIIDLVYERRPPFRASDVIAEVCAQLTTYRIRQVTGDRYAPGFVSGAFEQNRFSYVYSSQDRSQLYVEAMPLLTSRRVKLLDERRMIMQFASLERRTSAGGKDQVNHPEGQHDDLANAVAGVLVLASSGAGPMVINPEVMRGLRRRSEIRRRCEMSGVNYPSHRRSTLACFQSGDARWGR